MLKSTVDLVPDKPFFVTPEQTMSYAEFDDRSSRLARVLSEAGAALGDPVGILLPSGPELALTYWAVQKLGGVAVPLNPMYRELEVSGAISTVGPNILVTDRAHAANVAAGDAESLRLLLWDHGEHPLADAFVQALPWTDRPQVEMNSPVCMFLTSGTTGKPKAVVQTQLNQMAALTSVFANFGLRFGSETFLNTMPLFNNFGMTGVMNIAIFGGATMVSLERWKPQLALELISEHSVSAVWGTPTVYSDICENFDMSRHELTSIRRGITAGASASEALIDRFRKLTSVDLVQVYGATEATGAVTGFPANRESRIGAVGRPFPSIDVSIVDRNGMSLPVNETGEIRVFGDAVSPGYKGDPAGQAAAFSPEGWLSGDLGHLDEYGDLYLSGRRKEMIISGGNNIYPAEVEALLAKHEAVVRSVVIGIPDDRRGEVPAAIVVLRDDRRETTGAELTSFCAQNLSAYKVPHTIYFRKDLPLGPTGKVQRKVLLSEYTSADI
ncbi:class I adenylate-forming enzyme family protein [Brevibacterium aurantiacum]|uniref:Long-chain fatty acid--CoA ligase n=1 Tax=Brevibacterium aurantiacum TaxID=273384 RepID=A0A4Z0KER6_BREAU|nr:class I adenylate-forming enzyme family protein [Brevibacterium aurantiacum]TGD37041.1 long-chain fatty acid--CoA ligase [Brevibacterium aurantiacum]